MSTNQGRLCRKRLVLTDLVLYLSLFISIRRLISFSSTHLLPYPSCLSRLSTPRSLPRASFSTPALLSGSYQPRDARMDRESRENVLPYHRPSLYLPRSSPLPFTTNVSVRKELKVREGYVPQEDVGAFRGRRQQEADARRGVVPGTNGRAGVKGTKPENVFAQDPASKSKAQAKNEKRTVKRAELRQGRNWDSDENEEDDAEATRKAIEALSVSAFPPLSSSPKKEAVPAAKVAAPVPSTSAWKPVPAPSTSTTASTSAPVPSPPAARAPASASRRQASSTHAMQAPRGKPPPRPHPIQGGRIGPIGLAHPPPIESSRPPRRQAASSSVADSQSSWRRSSPAEPPRRQPSATEPRVRQPVRVREGAGGPLADRVRSLLMQNATPDRPRRSTPGSDSK